MKNILTKIVKLWNRFTRESEEWEYFEYLRRHPDQALFLENKTKADLAKELHDWKMRSNEQALTISQLKAEIEVYKFNKLFFKPEHSQPPTELIIKATINSDGTIKLSHDYE
jgi:hypothetical protein